ncbi:asparagine synthase-domain-containing protein [Lipomyces arxii]|uniref:asparagine synthase-domain-containing protein n=1 Tax=Lipomyces arxii TaxID=56418 RepID=UPI0034CEA887
MTLFSTVLSMRDPLVSQPLVEDSGSVLQFNGEIFHVTQELEKCNQQLLFNEHVKSVNDTALLATWFGQLGVLKTLRCVRGEYAFVYYDKPANKIWWARDCIGRRSLLVYRSDKIMVLSSVAPGDPKLRAEWAEVPAGVVYQTDLTKLDTTEFLWAHEGPTTLIYPYGTPSCKLSSNSRNVDLFSSVLSAAVRRRVLAINHSPATNSYAILFSGGIDCSIIAYLTCIVLRQHSATIDLLNVAFENPRIGGGYDTPDRVLGRRSWRELLILPQIKESSCTLRLVEIDVPFTQVQENKLLVQELMYPKESVMDFSIALAFFFAAKGCGTLFKSPSSTGQPYRTTSRILISGLGADELFAGYMRHATEFKHRGYEALVGELALDFGRLHERNLGRDDRVGAFWSREFRYPFLDEDFVSFALECPVDVKMREVNGAVEGKWLLRQFAREVGLTQVATEKKRAIQFGARSAKMEAGQGKVKGTAKFV